MMNDRRRIEPDKLEPSTEYFLSDGTTSVLVTTDETATKFMLQPSRLLGLLCNELSVTFDLRYMMSLNFFSNTTAFYDAL